MSLVILLTKWVCLTVAIVYGFSIGVKWSRVQTITAWQFRLFGFAAATFIVLQWMWKATG